MIIFKWIAIAAVILALAALIMIVLLVIVYCCVKWGTVGFYRGKEAFRKRRIDMTTIKDKKRKYENS